MIDEIRNKAKELLKTGQVEMLIGYKKASDGISAQPCVIENEAAAEQLIWDACCVYNLSNYLKDFPNKKTGIIAKACDVRSIAVLLQENQLKRENVFIIGVECRGVVAAKSVYAGKMRNEELVFSDKCKACEASIPAVYDVLIKEKKEKSAAPDDTVKDEYESIRQLEAKSLSERFKFWQEEFTGCIRCYACRQVCPMCYCPRCVADQTMPAWFSSAHSFEGNFSWNVTRAMHLAGRCADCGECERACPAGIPLRDINKKIEKDIKEMFNYQAGSSVEQKPLLSCFDKSDPDDFIR